MKYIGIMIEIFLIAGIIGICIVHLSGYMGIKTYIVRSGSMEPEIRTGSLCFVDTKVDYSEIKEYDIIAFERGKLLVTHRVVQVLKDGLVTKGDNNDLDDGITTTEKNYVGKSVFSIPLLGYAISWVQTRAARRSAIVSLFIVLGIQLFITKYLTN